MWNYVYKHFCEDFQCNSFHPNIIIKYFINSILSACLSFSIQCIILISSQICLKILKRNHSYSNEYKSTSTKFSKSLLCLFVSFLCCLSWCYHKLHCQYNCVFVRTPRKQWLSFSQMTRRCVKLSDDYQLTSVLLFVIFQYYPAGPWFIKIKILRRYYQ